MRETMRFKFRPSNNTLVVEEFKQPLAAKASNQWCYVTEIDLDIKEKKHIANMIVHLSNKRWAQESYLFFVDFVTEYLTLIDKQK